MCPGSIKSVVEMSIVNRLNCKLQCRWTHFIPILFFREKCSKEEESLKKGKKEYEGRDEVGDRLQVPLSTQRS